MGKRVDWKKIEEVVKKTKELGLTCKEGAEKFGIKVEHIYEYNRREKRISKSNEKNGGDKTRTDKKEKYALPEEVIELILDYRREHPTHGFKRIEDELKKKHLVVVKRKQIRKVLKENGLLEVLDSSFDKDRRKEKGTRRFEASYPRELYQMDVSYVYITGIRVLYLIVIIDDYSRFVVAADLCHDQRIDTLISVLHNAGILHGPPDKLLTDQGSGFYTWGHGQTMFQKYLDDHHIEHIVSEPHSPQTQGKVERVIQTIKKELLSRVRFNGYADARRGIFDYVRGYNYDRPHQGINGAKPSDRFYGIIGETDRIESELVARNLDFSKGYLVFKVEDHCLSVVYSSKGIQVLLDGRLLKEDPRNDKPH
jgi:transposase InsO family protein